MRQTRSVVSTFDDVAPLWGVAFVEEADFRREHCEDDSQLNIINATTDCWRWWPGQGTWAECILIHKRVKNYLYDVIVVGRIAGVVLSIRPGVSNIVMAGTPGLQCMDLIGSLQIFTEPSIGNGGLGQKQTSSSSLTSSGHWMHCDL
jgi:hypothetical protein